MQEEQQRVDDDCLLAVMIGLNNRGVALLVNATTDNMLTIRQQRKAIVGCFLSALKIAKRTVRISSTARTSNNAAPPSTGSARQTGHDVLAQTLQLLLLTDSSSPAPQNDGAVGVSTDNDHAELLRQELQGINGEEEMVSLAEDAATPHHRDHHFMGPTPTTRLPRISHLIRFNWTSLYECSKPIRLVTPAVLDPTRTPRTGARRSPKQAALGERWVNAVVAVMFNLALSLSRFAVATASEKSDPDRRTMCRMAAIEMYQNALRQGRRLQGRHGNSAPTNSPGETGAEAGGELEVQTASFAHVLNLSILNNVTILHLATGNLVGARRNFARLVFQFNQVARIIPQERFHGIVGNMKLLHSLLHGGAQLGTAAAA